jgi:hypothetical protein
METRRGQQGELQTGVKNKKHGGGGSEDDASISQPERHSDGVLS